MAEKLCPSCKKALKLRESGYPMGSAFLKADRVHVDIYECPECHGIRLYAAESDSNMVTCPKCGTVHNAKEACAVCALNAALDAEGK
ncbi:MAG: zf-TFIIB domain-containing protein [Synergistaceae bacterium]|nr:zf-TFIIB domain-containing protein [Synergistaceae bacterium]